MLKHFIFFLSLVFVFASCKQHSPEGLPKFKSKFKTQIASFEKQKEKTDKFVNKGLEGLSALQQALNDARNVDKEFNHVYGQWETVNKRVEKLNKEYEELKQRADDLFGAIDKQVQGLSDAKTRSELLDALRKSRAKYDKTLLNTSKAIDKLRTLHGEALEAIKTLEAAIAIGQIDSINENLKSIENRVGDIMKDLNMTVTESKKLYEQRMSDMQ
jgi:chromosome segregation ATPase